MPQVGETRTAGGETRQWTGARWEPVTGPVDASAQAPLPGVDKPAVDVGVLGMIPGFSDVVNLAPNVIKGAEALPDVVRGAVHHPLDTLKGFLEGSSEAMTPARAAELGLLTGGASLAGTGVAAGLAAAGQAGQTATDAPNAPTSLPQAGGRVLEAAALPASGAALGKAAEIARTINPRTLKIGGEILGGATGAYEGYEHGGVPGAILGAGTGIWGGSKLGMLADLIAGKTGSAAAKDVAEPPSGFANQPRPGRLSRPVAPYARVGEEPFALGGTAPESYWPQGTTIDPSAPPAPVTSASAVSAREIAQLKRQGISDKTIQDIITRETARVSPSSATTPTSAAPSPSASIADWKTRYAPETMFSPESSAPATASEPLQAPPSAPPTGPVPSGPESMFSQMQREGAFAGPRTNEVTPSVGSVSGPPDLSPMPPPHLYGLETTEASLPTSFSYEGGAIQPGEPPAAGGEIVLPDNTTMARGARSSSLPEGTLPHPLSEVPGAAPFWNSAPSLLKYAAEHPELKGTDAGYALNTRIRVLSGLDRSVTEHGGMPPWRK